MELQEPALQYGNNMNPSRLFGLGKITALQKRICRE